MNGTPESLECKRQLRLQKRRARRACHETKEQRYQSSLKREDVMSKKSRRAEEISKTNRLSQKKQQLSLQRRREKICHEESVNFRDTQNLIVATVVNYLS